MVLTVVDQDPFASMGSSDAFSDPFSSANAEDALQMLDSDDPFAPQSAFRDPLKISEFESVEDGEQLCGDTNPFFNSVSSSAQAKDSTCIKVCSVQEKAEVRTAVETTDLNEFEESEVEPSDLDPLPVAMISEPPESGEGAEKTTQSNITEDSGNATVSATEQAIYDILEDEKPDLRIPKLIFTEATVIDDASKTFESTSDGCTRLLDSSENSENVIQIDQDNTSEISTLDLNCGYEGFDVVSAGDSPDEFIYTRPDPPVDKSMSEAETQDTEMSGANFDNLRLDPNADENRALTSSPIFDSSTDRTRCPEDQTSRDYKKEWEQQAAERINIKDQREEIDIASLRETAQKELEEFYSTRASELEAQHRLHSENGNKEQTSLNGGESTWKRVRSLVLDLKRNQAQQEQMKSEAGRLDNFLRMIKKKLEIEQQVAAL